MDILGIGAHPDGIELSCGGLPITAAREGQRLSPRCHRAVSGDPHERSEESKKAAQFIGAKGLCIDDFPEGRLGVTSELINRIEARIDSVNAGVILTHFAADVHRDHRAILSAALEAERSQNIFDCEIPLTRNFEPMVYFDITDDADYDVELIDIICRSGRGCT